MSSYLKGQYPQLDVGVLCKVNRGLVAVSKHNGAGGTLLRTLLVQGDIYRVTHDEAVWAVLPCEMVEVGENPQAELQSLTALLSRTCDLLQLLSLPQPARIPKMLDFIVKHVELPTQDGIATVDLSQEQLAELCHIDRVTVSRSFTLLRRENKLPRSFGKFHWKLGASYA